VFVILTSHIFKLISTFVTTSVLIDAYMRHTFKCAWWWITHIRVIQSNTPGADWYI